jgi:hypothetical protein
MLTALIVLLRSIGLLCRGHRAVALENLALRQQLAALTRPVKRPQLRRRDRLFWIPYCPSARPNRQGNASAKLERELAAWEEWEAEVLQNHLSYPMLAYFRSQHTNQSWPAMLTAIVDASALVLISSDADLKRHAGFTFAMGRHALVDLAMVFGTRPFGPDVDRLSADECSRLRKTIAARATALQVDRITDAELKKLRASYEPYAHALSQYFLSALPPWIPIEPKPDNWQRTAWNGPTPPFAVSDPFTSD